MRFYLKRLLFGLSQFLRAYVLGLARLDEKGYGVLIFAKEFFHFIDRKAL